MADCCFFQCQALASRPGIASQKTIQQVDGFSPFVAEEDYEVSKQNAKHVKLNSNESFETEE
jgi:hypothetical protein